LDGIEMYGEKIYTSIAPAGMNQPENKNTVAYEAKLIKRMILDLKD